MERSKITIEHAVLGRPAHIDAFTIGRASPRTTVLMFGGSGMSREEYERRAQTIVPVFDDDLVRLESEGIELAFFFVSAPWDVSFADVVTDDTVSAHWRRHVELDIRPLVETSTTYGCAYSGGAALLLSGVHESMTGATIIGGDLVPEDFTKPDAWPSPLIAVYNLADPVFAANRGIVEQLVEAEDARLLRKLPGTHAFADYVGNGTWAGVLRRAWQESKSKRP